MKTKYAILLAVLAVSACTGNRNTCKISGCFGEGFSYSDSCSAYLLDDGIPIDSCRIVGGEFTFSYPIDSRLLLSVVYPSLEDMNSFQIFFIPDTKEISVCIDNSPVVSGSPLSDGYNKLLNDYTSLDHEYVEKAGRLRNEGDYHGADSVLVARKEAIKLLCSEKYLKNADNAFGVLALTLMCLSLSDEEFVSLFEKGGEAIKSTSTLFGFYTQAKSRLGQIDEDFYKVGDGSIKFYGPEQFDSYFNRGNYVLADFWASWCGPCIESLPGVIDINEKYSGKGLTVIGVTMMDSPENSYKIAKQYGIEYDQIVDASTEFTEKFNFNGLPHLILFDSQGNIVYEGYSVIRLEEKLDSIFNF